VDVNHLNRTTGWEAIAKRTFSIAEQEAFAGLPHHSQEETFYRVWSQKEAYTKAFGCGFSYGFRNFSVLVAATGEAGLLADEKSPDLVDQWNIVPVEAGTNLVAALAYDGTSTPVIRQWTFV